jgi:hypothetical protein
MFWLAEQLGGLILVLGCIVAAWRAFGWFLALFDEK